MEPIKENEQWKLDGNCPLCRRFKYCYTECTASKKVSRHVIQRAIREKFPKVYLNAFAKSYSEEDQV